MWLLTHLQGIRARLTLWYVLALALVVTVSVYAISVALARVSEVELDDTLRAASLAMAAAYDPTSGQIAPDVLAASRRERWIVVVFDSNGESRQVGGPLEDEDVERLRGLVTAGAPTAGFTLDSSRGDATAALRLIAVPIVRDGSHVGTIIVGAQPATAADITHRHAVAALVVFAVTMAFGTLPGYWIARRAMQPVREITRLAREISDSDLSRRLRMDGRDEIGELARTFDAMLARLQAAFDRQRQFTADASHELRTPVSIISLEAQQALERPRTLDEYRQALVAIRAESEHMARLVADLLDLARAEGGQTVLAREPLDLSDLTLEVVERLAPAARLKALRVTVAELPELLVMGDRAQLSRMLSNVLDNAIKYTAGYGRQVCVATGSRSRDTGSWAWVRVDDDGRGINAADLPHLFDRFYRVDAARTSASGDGVPGGHGLGLAIARWVARAHGGDIEARNRPAGGASFEIVLPRADR
jgi:two-component system OmpR family sensor kinase